MRSASGGEAQGLRWREPFSVAISNTDTMTPDMNHYSDDAPEPDLSTVDGLIEGLERQARLLIAVATGGPRIEDVQWQYQQRRQSLLQALSRRSVPYPFPWSDLWDWYGDWSGGTLPNYFSRRQRVRRLIEPALDALERQRSSLALADPGSGAAGTWPDLDARVAGLAVELADAASLDDLQDVGRRAREVLVDCARLLADPALVPPDTPAPKAGDAKAWLDLFLADRASGQTREELRRLVRAAWELAQKVTHADIDRVDAYAAAQATVLVVRTLQELSRP
jgi:hypothetical protein